MSIDFSKVQKATSGATSIALPNVLLLVILTATMMWITKWDFLVVHERRHGPDEQVLTGFGTFYGQIHGIGRFRPETLHLETALFVTGLLVIDFLLLARFARRWRARRWGRKPAEIERATRYFNGYNG